MDNQGTMSEEKKIQEEKSTVAGNGAGVSETALRERAYDILENYYQDNVRMTKELELYKTMLPELVRSTKLRRIYDNKLKRSGKKSPKKLDLESQELSDEDYCSLCGKNVENRTEHIVSAHFRVKCKESFCGKEMFVKNLVLHQQKCPAHENDMSLLKMIQRRRKVFYGWFQKCYGKSLEEDKSNEIISGKQTEEPNELSGPETSEEPIEIDVIN